MSLSSLVFLMLTHVVFDFLLQDRETAKNKSSKFSYLFPHLFLIYIGLMLYGVFAAGYSQKEAFIFAVLNTILHGIIDWNIWKLYKYTVIRRFPDATFKFEYYEDSWFYNFIALDQLLHGLCYLAVHSLITGGLSSYF